MIEPSVPGSVIGDTMTSLPLGRSSAAIASQIDAVPVETASAYPPPISATKSSV